MKNKFQLVQEARELYDPENIQILGNIQTKNHPEKEGIPGTWISAWVFVPETKTEEE